MRKKSDGNREKAVSTLHRGSDQSLHYCELNCYRLCTLRAFGFCRLFFALKIVRHHA